MEDTHVWVMDADGRNRREVCHVDNRQGSPEWSPDGRSLFFTIQSQGSTVLYRQALDGGDPRKIPADGAGTGGGSAPERLTALNEPVFLERGVVGSLSFTFKSFDGREVEAFLTAPSGQTSNSKHPLIVMIHGGPHGQQGPAFNSKAQIYSAQGWATLMVNYRGSTGYGQKHADAIFKDQDGGEAKDVLAGVDAALARYPWIDKDRLGIEGGSYGGQLTDWIITQTDRFKAAIPSAGIANLVSFNYMAYYHDYLAVEFGAFPHEQGLMDLLWERSALRYVSKVKTPVMFIHGENDNDVPIAEAEQYFIALRDA